MKIFKFAIVTMMALGLYSCGNENEPGLKENQTSETEVFAVTAKYKGKTYSVECKYEKDSLIYLDYDFNEMYVKEISSNPDMAVLISKDSQGNDVISYYDSSTELEQDNGFDILPSEEGETLSRYGTGMQPTAARAILYDDTNFKDRTIELDLDLTGYYYCRFLLEGYKFNDKTSAIRLFNFLQPATYYPNVCKFGAYGRELRICLIGYEHSFHQGKRLYCVAQYTEGQDLYRPETAPHQDYKLRKIGWNDKISSVELKIIRVSEMSQFGIEPHKPCQ